MRFLNETLGPGTLIALAIGVGAGCGEVSNDPNGLDRPISRAGTGGQGNAGSSQGGRGGRAGEAGSGGQATVDAGGGADGGAAGTSAGGSGSQQWPDLPADCPVPNPIPVTGQTIALVSLNFDNSEVVLQNVSDQPQVILGGRQGWQWCQFPAYWTVYETADVELSPGETFAFPLIYRVAPREIFPEGGELGIYTTTGSFTTASLMRAFVSWGDVLPQRESTAVQAGLWTYEDRIQIEPGDSGFVLVGRADRAASYQSVRAACLVPPPNE
jgi:hypothetical protein